MPNRDIVLHVRPLHLFDIGGSVAAFAMQPDIVAVAVKEDQFRDNVLQQQPVPLIHPAVPDDWFGGAAPRRDAFDWAGSVVDTEGGPLALPKDSDGTAKKEGSGKNQLIRAGTFHNERVYSFSRP